MSARRAKLEIEREKASGEYNDKSTFSSQSWDRNDQVHNQQLTSKRQLLNNESIIVPGDLTPQAISQGNNELTQKDWSTAELNVFKAQPDMKPTMLRIIFFRGLDAHNSFSVKNWQTRVALLSIRLTKPANRTPGAQTYLNAVEEAKTTPYNFTAREAYVSLFDRSKSAQARYSNAIKKRCEATIERLHKLDDYYKQNPQAVAADALALVAQSTTTATTTTTQAEVDAMTADFDKFAENVIKEFNEADMVRRMEIMQLVDKDREAKAMAGAFGVSS